MQSSTNTTRTYLLIALLAACAVLLRLGENLLPLPAQFNGFRFGLANTITIMALYLFGLRLTGLLLSVRILLVGLLSTGLFSPGFCIGLSGTILSLFAMYLGQRMALFSPYGIGVLGACFHNLGQLLAASVLMQSTSILVYLPIFLLISLPCGLLTGAIAAKLLPILKKELL